MALLVLQLILGCGRAGDSGLSDSEEPGPDEIRIVEFSSTDVPFCYAIGDEFSCWAMDNQQNEYELTGDYPDFPVREFWPWESREQDRQIDWWALSEDGEFHSLSGDLPQHLEFPTGTDGNDYLELTPPGNGMCMIGMDGVVDCILGAADAGGTVAARELVMFDSNNERGQCALDADGQLACGSASYGGVPRFWEPVGGLEALASVKNFVCGVSTSGSLQCANMSYEEPIVLLEEPMAGDYVAVSMSPYDGTTCLTSADDSVHCFEFGDLPVVFSPIWDSSPGLRIGQARAAPGEPWVVCGVDLDADIPQCWDLDGNTRF